MSRPTPSPTFDGRARIVLAIAALAAAIVHIRSLWFVCDDAYITFRYGANLAHGLGPVFNAGERVEGYTNFLWMLLSAVVVAVGGRPEAWMPVASAGAALATIAAVIAWTPRGAGAGSAGVIAGLLLAASASFAAWATSGLETALFTLLVTLAYLALARGAPIAAAAALSLAAWTRPEGMLIAAGAGGYAVLFGARLGITRRAALTMVAFVAGCVAAHLAFRLVYYGHWLPNTFAVKAPGPASFARGSAYLFGAIRSLHLEVLAVPVAALLVLDLLRRPVATHDESGRGRSELLAAIVVPYLLYLTTIRGDFMPLHRFAAPMLPLLAIAAGRALDAVVDRMAWWGPRSAAAGFALLAIFAVPNIADSMREQYAGIRNGLETVELTRQNAANWVLVGRKLREVALPTDTLAITAAGIVPYYSGLPTIDLLGLTAPDLSAYHPGKTDRPGHELYLSSERLIQLRPQLLLGQPELRESMVHAGLGLEFEPEWRERVFAPYELVGFEVGAAPPRYFRMAVRKDVASRIGQAGLRSAIAR